MKDRAACHLQFAAAATNRPAASSAIKARQTSGRRVRAIRAAGSPAEAALRAEADSAALAAVDVARGGGGGRGPGGGRGGRGNGPGGVPWGLQRAVRQRINQEHFSVYNIFGDSVWNARPFSLQGQSQSQPAYYQERFGGNAGGPLKIPKLYDGTDKTFFFLNVEVGRNQNPLTDFSTVPTAAERSGNFCGAGVTLYDYTSNFDGPRTALPCNISGMINPISAGLLQYVPAPNLTATASSPYNYLLETTVPNNTFSVNGRIIQTINAKFNFMVAYNIRQAYSADDRKFPGADGHDVISRAECEHRLQPEFNNAPDQCHELQFHAAAHANAESFFQRE